MEIHLLRSCLSICKINHLLCTVPCYLISDALQHFDTSLRSTLSSILRSSIHDINWHQATLLFSLGGYGLREAVPTAPIAFLTSVTRSKLIISSTMPSLYNSRLVADLAFVGEVACKQVVSELLGSLIDDVCLDSQPSILAATDQLHYDTLLASLDLYGRAHLKTLSASNDTSAWLKALPIFNLGLSIPQPNSSLPQGFGWEYHPLQHPPHQCAPVAPQLTPMATIFWDVARALSASDGMMLCGTSFSMPWFRTTPQPKETSESMAIPKTILGIFTTRISPMVCPPTSMSLSVCPCSPALLTNPLAKLVQQVNRGNSIRILGSRYAENVESRWCFRSSGSGITGLVDRKSLTQITSRTTISNGLSSSIATTNLLQQLAVALWHYNAKCS